MDNKTSYQTLIDELSATEKTVFEALLSRVEQVGGNLQDLSVADQAKLAALTNKHNTTSEKVSLPTVTSGALSADETSFEPTAYISNVAGTLRPMETDFGIYLIDTINESLCKSGSSTSDAIRYAFHNRWMPETLKNKDICEKVYYRYREEIDDANRLIQKQSSSQDPIDAVVAVGLAWFTNLYRCYQLVEAEGDI